VKVKSTLDAKAKVDSDIDAEDPDGPKLVDEMKQLVEGANEEHALVEEAERDLCKIDA
jgi:hypothetical protein